MKKLRLTTVLFLLVIILGCTIGEKTKNSLTKENLIGKVKFINASDYDAVEMFGEIAKGTLTYKYTYKYDEKGNKIEENQYNANGTLNYKTTFKYEFDASGNWIKQTESKDGKPSKIKEREIEYY